VPIEAALCITFYSELDASNPDPGYRFSLHPPTSFDHVNSVAQSICLHDVDGTRAVELPLEFEVVSPPV
jgi:hypothetical protein